MKTKILLSSLGGGAVTVAAAVGIGVPLATSTTSKQNSETIIGSFAYAPETANFSMSISYAEAYDNDSLDSFLQSALGGVSDVFSSYSTYFDGEYKNVTGQYKAGSADYENNLFLVTVTPTSTTTWDDYSTDSRSLVVTLTNLSKEDTSITNPDEETPGDDTQEDTPGDDTQEDTPGDDTQEDTPGDDVDNDVQEGTDTTPISGAKVWVSSNGLTQLWTDNNGTVSGYSTTNDLNALDGQFTLYDGKANTYWTPSTYTSGNNYWHAYIQRHSNVVGNTRYNTAYAGAITFTKMGTNNSKTKVSWPGWSRVMTNTYQTAVYDGYVVANTDVTFKLGAQKFVLKEGGFLNASNGNFIATNAYVIDDSDWNSVATTSNIVTASGITQGVEIDGDGSFVVSGDGAVVLTDSEGNEYTYDAIKTGMIWRFAKTDGKVVVERVWTRVYYGSDTWASYKYKEHTDIVSVKILKGEVFSHLGYCVKYNSKYGKYYLPDFRDTGNLTIKYGNTSTFVKDGSFSLTEDGALVATSATNV